MSAGEEPAESSPRLFFRRRRLLWAWLTGLGVIFFLLLAVLSVFLIHKGRPPPTIAQPVDPRLEYAGPFRNVRPSIQYVADSLCANCHEKEATSFAEHPMGRSLLPIAQALAPAGSAAHDIRFPYLGSIFHIDVNGEKVWHRRTQSGADGKVVIEQTWEVQYVIGSGSRGYSYLTQADGFLFQSPVSWYSQKKRWDVSPAFAAHQMPGRAVLPGCLFCHSNRANHHENTTNGYANPAFDGHSIGCQRCHGPGELHVASAGTAHGIDDSIVNPKHLSPPLRQAVCEQCHLHGQARISRHGRELYDFRPGLPLESFWSVFVESTPTETKKAVGQVEQMYESRCFQRSAGPGQLGCVSCHDPHARVPQAQRVSFYRDRCLQCHAQNGCSLPLPDRVRRSAEDSCMDCHMPRYGTADIAHTASTDHRILRHGKPVSPATSKPAFPKDVPLAAFYDLGSGDVAESDRDLALAVVELAASGDPAATRALGRVLPKLDAAIKRDPNDFNAAESKARVLGLQGHSGEAMALYEEILTRSPDRETSLSGAALIAESLGLRDSAIGYWRRAVARNPRSAVYRHSLTLLLTKSESWAEALRQCEEWVRLDAFSAVARSTRVMCLLAVGHKEEAKAEFTRIEALAPANLDELRARFDRHWR